MCRSSNCWNGPMGSQEKKEQKVFLSTIKNDEHEKYFGPLRRSKSNMYCFAHDGRSFVGLRNIVKNQRVTQ